MPSLSHLKRFFFCTGMMGKFQCAPCGGKSVSATHNKQAKVRADFFNINVELSYKSATSRIFHRPQECSTPNQCLLRCSSSTCLSKPGEVPLFGPPCQRKDNARFLGGSPLLVRVDEPAPFLSRCFSPPALTVDRTHLAQNVDSIQSERKKQMECIRRSCSA